MKLDVDLPQLILVEDYHDFGTAQYFLRRLNESISVEEIGLESIHSAGLNEYVGIIFLEKDSEYHRLKSKAIEQHEIS